jgi:hypothetical protein
LCGACPPGTFSELEASAACTSCPNGTFSDASESTQCADCPDPSLCPLASVAALSAVPVAVVSQANPITDAAEATSTDTSGFHLSLGIALVVVVLLLVLLATALMVLCRVDWKPLDLLHRIRAVAAPPTAAGGILTICALIVALFVVIYSVYDYTHLAKYEYSLSPDAPNYRPQAGSTPLTISARFVGCPKDDCVAASILPTGFASR